jgi:hypothetical protein
MSNVWFFQANPDTYKVDEYLAQTNYIYWSIKTVRHRLEIRVGDDAYLWRARGQSNGPRGILAKCVVAELPKKNDFDFDESLGDDLWLDDSKRAEYHVGLRVVQSAPPNSVIVDEELLLNHDVLKNLIAIRQRTGTSFRESNPQIERSLYELWNSQSVILDPTAESFGSEGKQSLSIHVIYERDARVVREKKRSFEKNNSKLYCEVCGFDFEEKYGTLGKSFIEVHHKTPISVNQVRQTKLEDLVCVCSNCHRMLHRNADFDENLKYLLARFSK